MLQQEIEKSMISARAGAPQKPGDEYFKIRQLKFFENWNYFFSIVTFKQICDIPLLVNLFISFLNLFISLIELKKID